MQLVYYSASYFVHNTFFSIYLWLFEKKQWFSDFQNLFFFTSEIFKNDFMNNYMYTHTLHFLTLSNTRAFATFKNVVMLIRNLQRVSQNFLFAPRHAAESNIQLHYSLFTQLCKYRFFNSAHCAVQVESSLSRSRNFRVPLRSA